MPAFDDFMPEELEIQHRELTTLLTQIYQQPVSVEETIAQSEQEHILAEVRTYLLTARLTDEESSTTPARIRFRCL